MKFQVELEIFKINLKIVFCVKHFEGLELKRTMSTLVGFEIIEFQTLQASEKSGN